MVISPKQQESNRRNAQHSTGPTTPEGKKAASLNAVTYGLRTRSLLIQDENIADYWRLWDGLEAEWQPETATERLYLEQMSVAQWLLARMAASEQRVHASNLAFTTELDLLDRIDKRRTRLERSFTAAVRELKQLQKERRQRQAQRQQPATAKQSTQAPVQPPGYVMSEDTENRPAFCAPETTDSR
jgi:regulator of extracellular matrix RemA (YlzA/DUF370 family)